MQGLPESREELFSLGLELLDKGKLIARLNEMGVDTSDLRARTETLHQVIGVPGRGLRLGQAMLRYTCGPGLGRLEGRRDIRSLPF